MWWRIKERRERENKSKQDKQSKQEKKGYPAKQTKAPKPRPWLQTLTSALFSSDIRTSTQLQSHVKLCRSYQRALCGHVHLSASWRTKREPAAMHSYRPRRSIISLDLEFWQNIHGDLKWLPLCCLSIKVPGGCPRCALPSWCEAVNATSRSIPIYLQYTNGMFQSFRKFHRMNAVIC